MTTNYRLLPTPGTTLVLLILITLVSVTLPGCTSKPSLNQYLDEQEGLEQIEKQVREWTGEGYQLTRLVLTAQSKNSSLERLSMSAVSREKVALPEGGDRKVQVKTTYNVKQNALERDSTYINSSYYKTETPMDIAGIHRSIEQCKTLIPPGYNYRQVNNIEFRTDRTTFAVVVSKEKEATGSKQVYRKKKIKYEKQYRYGSKGRRIATGNKAVEYYIYTMKFEVTKDGVVVR